MKSALESLSTDLQNMKSKLIDLINNLPENAEGIVKLGRNCCVVPISVITKNNLNMSPRYYLHVESKQAMIRMIESSTGPDILIKRMEEIIKIGAVGQERIHPEFIKALTKIWRS
jgi:hypothetical protein